MIWILTYPHDGWLDPQTVTLSVCAPGEVSVCRIGGVPTPGGGGPLYSSSAYPSHIMTMGFCDAPPSVRAHMVASTMSILGQ